MSVNSLNGHKGQQKTLDTFDAFQPHARAAEILLAANTERSVPQFEKQAESGNREAKVPHPQLSLREQQLQQVISKAEEELEKLANLLKSKGRGRPTKTHTKAKKKWIRQIDDAKDGYLPGERKKERLNQQEQVLLVAQNVRQHISTNIPAGKPPRSPIKVNPLKTFDSCLLCTLLHKHIFPPVFPLADELSVKLKIRSICVYYHYLFLTCLIYLLGFH